MSASPADKATRSQREAAAPDICAWVSASAGSGKTKVLEDRLLRLMLDGTAPEHILCITFTKAGAAEIRARVANRLARWAIDPEAELLADLRKLMGGTHFGESLIAKARGLLAHSLDAPGGLRIETIHAFCQSVLRRFPFEARISPYFEVLDELSAKALLDEAQQHVFATAKGSLRAAIAHIANGIGQEGFQKLLGSLLDQPSHLAGLRAASGGSRALEKAFRRLLGLPATGDNEDYLRKELADKKFAKADLRKAAEALRIGEKKDKQSAEKLTAWLAADLDRRVADYPDYYGIFFTQKDKFRESQSLGSQSAQKALPNLRAILEEEAERLQQVEDNRRAFRTLENSRALTEIGLAVFDRYAALKRGQARLDYDDLILGVRELLHRPDFAPWILYKLDREADHILIDEAQDTNPAQWEIVKKLTEDWVAGEGASAAREPERRRTIFVVGDYKQSIFSFQGADPESFRAAGDYYRSALYDHRAANDSRPEFRDVPLEISFRSTRAVLAVIDAVFAGAAKSGVVVAGDTIRHEANRQAAGGEVVLWPKLVPIKSESDVAKNSEADDIRPQIVEDQMAPRLRLAKEVAGEIRRLIAEERLPARDRPIRAGDILVLLRTRSVFFPALARELRARDVSVSGLDRLRLLDEIAIQDLIAAIEFLNLPEDDLNLAALLKSPLYGIDEESLFDLAAKRGEHSLWEYLNELAKCHSRWAEIARHLHEFRQAATGKTPYEILADLLQAKGGRRRMKARLGEEIDEALDELLNLALFYEREPSPSLQGFPAWLRASEAEVKREATEENADHVRIMTIHGAKGLEAPVVFVIDDKMKKTDDDKIFWKKLDAYSLPLWSESGTADCAHLRDLREAAAERRQREENRLFYVALTRAADRLYLCACRGRIKFSGETWHDMAAAAMAQMPDIRRRAAADWRPGEAGWEGDHLVYAIAQDGLGEKEPKRAALPIDLETSLPDFAAFPPAPEPDPPRPLIPSRRAEPEPAMASPLSGDGGDAFRRGLLIHKLFQILPDLPVATRAATARAWLDRQGFGGESGAAMIAEILAVLDHPDHALLFGPGSRAEAPIVARLRDRAGQSRILSGQIDRLVVTETRILIVDYKTHRVPPMHPQQVAPAYLGQLAAYESALAEIYPGRPIACYLLWTAVPKLMAMPDHLLAPYRAASRSASP